MCQIQIMFQKPCPMISVLDTGLASPVAPIQVVVGVTMGLSLVWALAWWEEQPVPSKESIKGVMDTMHGCPMINVHRVMARVGISPLVRIASVTDTVLARWRNPPVTNLARASPTEIIARDAPKVTLVML